jgi:hypothetical protein
VAAAAPICAICGTEFALDGEAVAEGGGEAL